jgi:hypothetical protein
MERVQFPGCGLRFATLTAGDSQEADASYALTGRADGLTQPTIVLRSTPKRWYAGTAVAGRRHRLAVAAARVPGRWWPSRGSVGSRSQSRHKESTDMLQNEHRLVSARFRPGSRRRRTDCRPHTQTYI